MGEVHVRLHVHLSCVCRGFLVGVPVTLIFNAISTPIHNTCVTLSDLLGLL